MTNNPHNREGNAFGKKSESGADQKSHNTTIRVKKASGKRPFSVKDRIRSFKYAFNGIGILIRSQHNFWIHIMAALIVCTAGLCLGLTKPEWCWIVLAITGVWTAEGFNTALESLADATSPEYNPLVGKAKDVSAGAVLIAAIGSVVIGVLVAGPHLLRLLKK